ncbi:tetratricopeptide repeat protein [Acidiphilium sp.]|uniref:CHAT domain-containing protein n=1 Tax=Acidiphilium sp. TaxID=527 RepID=UPI003D06B3FC
MSEPPDAAPLIEAARAALGAGDYAAARRGFEAALALQRESLGEAHLDVAETLNQLGRINLEQGAMVAARACFERTLEIRRGHYGDDHPDVAASWNNLGIQHKEEGNFTTAAECHRRALDIRLRVLGPDHGMVGYSYSNLAAVERNQGAYIAARRHLELALPILRTAFGAAHFSVAAALSNLGIVLTTLGDYAAARDCHEQALAIRRADGGEDGPGVGNALLNLGFTLLESGDAAAARPYFEQALAIFRRCLGPVNPDVASCLTNLGQIAATLDDAAAARDHLTQALAMRRSLLGEDHPEVALLLVECAALDLREGAVAEARAGLAGALAIASLPEGAAIRRIVWQGLSRMEAAAARIDAAIFFGKQAINAIQRMRGDIGAVAPDLQRSFAAANAAAYRHLADLLASAGRLAEAELVIAMLKEEELFDLLRRDAASDPRLTFVQLTSLEARWQRHGDELIEAIAQLTALARLAADDAAQSERRAAIEAEIRDVRGRFDHWLAQALAAFAQERQAHAAEIGNLNREALAAMQVRLGAVGPHVGLVHFLPGERRMTIILTTARLQISREVEIGEVALNRLIHELRVAIAHQTDDVLLVARRLERFLIAPIAEVIDAAGLTVLGLGLVGALRYLPFAALHDGERYLIERVALVMQIGAARRSGAAAEIMSRRDWHLAGLGVAREIPPHRPLAMVADELSRIVADPQAGTAGIFPGRIHLDAAFDATTLATALRDHPVVHVASHFVLAAAHPAQSYLLLGDGSTLSLDGLRDAAFAFERVDLMTLSACETAMGGGSGGEVEGIGALVCRQGARAVLATLWPVADSSTPVLMEGFYRACRSGSWKHDALRAAQCAMIAAGGETAHPYHWAGVILMGRAI